mmetsp:Transcript_28598/g.69492  ORF Transcript_28598/g.69492 Transcript_28598/m.69492 type:complete len:131 (-) Transcript_28598:91-483(-)
MFSSLLAPPPHSQTAPSLQQSNNSFFFDFSRPPLEDRKVNTFTHTKLNVKDTNHHITDSVNLKIDSGACGKSLLITLYFEQLPSNPPISTHFIPRTVTIVSLPSSLFCTLLLYVYVTMPTTITFKLLLTR